MIKRKDEQPTTENIIRGLKEGSLLRVDEVKRFIAFLDSVEPPYIVCIDAPWGDGKTFFVRTAQLILEYRNPHIRQHDSNEFLEGIIDEEKLATDACEFLPVYFNAWENDTLANPLGALIASIAVDCEVDFSLSETSLSEKAAALADSIGGSLGLSPNIAGLREAFSGKELIEEFRRRRNLESAIDDFIALIMEERAQKVVLFIDELDRCRPEFAIKLLSEIKNLFENENLIIVLSADLTQLANSLAGVYGSDFDSTKYLERFYDRRFDLAPIPKGQYVNGLRSNLLSAWNYDKITKSLYARSSGTMRNMNRLNRVEEARPFATRKGSGNIITGFAESGLLPVLLFVENERPDLWQRVKRGESLDDVYEYAADVEPFIVFLDRTLISIYGNEWEPNEEDRRSFISDLCAMIFLPTDIKSERRVKAEKALDDLMWGTTRFDVFHSLDFSEFQS